MKMKCFHYLQSFILVIDVKFNFQNQTRMENVWRSSFTSRLKFGFVYLYDRNVSKYLDILTVSISLSL